MTSLSVGAGGAGLRATLGMAEQGLKTACISKGGGVFPTRSHTVRGPGRHRASLGNMGGPITGTGTCMDTVKGSDWLGRQRTRWNTSPARRPKAVYELEHYGVPYLAHRGMADLPAPLRRPYDRVRRRPARAAAPAPPPDRTGHAILHTLYGQSLKKQREFYIEYFATDLLMNDEGHCVGVVAWKLDDGTMHVFRAKMVVLATGGYGRAYFSATPAHTLHRRTAAGMVARQGLPLQDMEFVQFHPTGIYGAGCLITGGRAGRGWAYLTNSEGERFMERYRADLQGSDVARDVVSRCNDHGVPIRKAGGVGKDGDHIDLHLNPLPPETRALRPSGHQ